MAKNDYLKCLQTTEYSKELEQTVCLRMRSTQHQLRKHTCNVTATTKTTTKSDAT